MGSLLKISITERVLRIVYYLPALAMHALNYRVPNFFITRIGHLLLEPELVIKAREMGLVPRYKYILLASSNWVANRAALRYLEQHYTVVSLPILVKLMSPFSRHPLTRFDVADYISTKREAKFSSILTQWGDRPPLFSLSHEDEVRGQEALRQLGLPEGAWFICVHSRESGYSAYDDHIHDYRNSKIEDYEMAIRYIVSQGGWCIRVGDPSSRQAPELDGLIDYAHHPLRSDWLDLYLCAKARFFLGNSSGALYMSAVFGVPVACANLAPMAAVFPYDERVIGIPKLYRRKAKGGLIPFLEILNSPMGDFRSTQEFIDAGIELVDSTPEEILELTREQLERTAISQICRVDADSNLRQTQFKSLFRPGHYSYGSSSSIGQAFLERHKELL
jgi:putative glycosyltransferase (TIGR04372 family)